VLGVVSGVVAGSVLGLVVLSIAGVSVEVPPIPLLVLLAEVQADVKARKPTPNTATTLAELFSKFFTLNFIT
jgi:uncharacterized membrane protein (UPF0136 family)